MLAAHLICLFVLQDLERESGASENLKSSYEESTAKLAELQQKAERANTLEKNLEAQEQEAELKLQVRSLTH